MSAARLEPTRLAGDPAARAPRRVARVSRARQLVGKMVSRQKQRLGDIALRAA